jgi:cysteine desulfurase family protein
MIYLDNAATSFPKPGETIDAVHDFLTRVGGNPGRGGHLLSIDAARIVYEARERLTGFIGGSASERLIFTQNGTDSLNLAILGLIEAGDHVITTGLEHNSVMRPLEFLKKTRNIEVSIVPCSSSGDLDLPAMKSALRPTTRIVIVNHGSNVIGTVQPVEKIREIIGQKILVLDACQTIGNIPLHVENDGIDVCCFSCHKALFGIQGLGALYIRHGIDPVPSRFGGTGSNSEQMEQPEALPDRYESGTPNTPGIAALLGGMKFIERIGFDQVSLRKRAATERILEGIRKIDDIEVYGPERADERRLPVISINVKGVEPSEVGYACNRAGICVRVGLHCSPLAHRTIGTFPRGAVRISPGYFTENDHIESLLEVLRTLADR